MNLAYLLLPMVELAAAWTGQDPNRNPWYARTRAQCDAEAKEELIRLHARDGWPRHKT